MSSGSGSLAGTASVAAINGVATFSGLSISNANSSVILTASNAGVRSASTGSFVVGYGPSAIGQTDLNNNYNLATGLNLPGSSMSDGTKLFVADSSNNRVLIWNSIPSSNRAADLVLGHSNTTGASTGGLSSKSLSRPVHVFADGTRIAVADQGNHRVLIWNSYPTSSYAPADVVLGQPDMTSNTSNNGGVSAQSLSWPNQVFWVGTKFFVVDYNNSRVLIWNSFPTANGQAADLVLGQPNMTSDIPNNGGISAQTLNYPVAVHSDGTKLFVSDQENHRVLIWNAIPAITQTAADLVLGQPDMVSSAINNGGISGQTLRYPNGIHSAGGKFFVADYNNNRILVWNSIPTANQQSADLVLGQPNLTSRVANNGGTSAQSLNSPLNVFSTGSQLIVTDMANSRVLIWTAVPTVTQTAANTAIGQPDTGSMTVNSNTSLQNSFSAPGGVYSTSNRFVVADTTHNRVLIWNQPPATHSIPADIVLGQPDLSSVTANNGGVTAQSLYHPQSVCSDGTKLFVADKDNNRVLIWNSWPTSNQQAADLELGQPDMTSNALNNGGVTAQSMFRPVDCATDGTHLFVADQANMRILMWNTIPTINRQAADLAQGQGSLTQRFWLSTQAAGFDSPSSVAISGTKLIASDSSDSRVFIWNTIPTVNRQVPDVYLGQADFSTNIPNFGGLSNRSLKSPGGVRVIDGRLYVMDSGNHRIMYWNTIPTSTYAIADGVLGQPDFTSNSLSNGGLSSGFNNPTSISNFLFNGISHLLVTDTGNDRVILTP
jgi:hypothetical protein